MMNLTSKSLVDSNIIVYSLDITSAKNSKAKSFLLKNSSFLIVAHQNILESIRIMTHPKNKNRVEINLAITSVSDLVSELPIIYPQKGVLKTTINFVEKYNLRGDQIFDAYLAATALSHGVSAIITDNEKDFLKIKEIKILNPFK